MVINNLSLVVVTGDRFICNIFFDKGFIFLMKGYQIVFKSIGNCNITVNHDTLALSTKCISTGTTLGSK